MEKVLVEILGELRAIKNLLIGPINTQTRAFNDEADYVGHLKYRHGVADGQFMALKQKKRPNSEWERLLSGVTDES